MNCKIHTRRRRPSNECWRYDDDDDDYVGVAVGKNRTG